MKEYGGLDGVDLMGDNLRDKVKFLGTDVRLYPLAKMIHAQNAELDNNCQIMDFVFIDAGKSLKIGKYSTITWHCLIEGGANTYIGDRVFLGPGSKILTSTYKLNGYYAIEHIPEECRGTIYGDIVIENDAYIGANCTILPGSIIHEGAVVGANSLVKGELEPWTTYVGAPCKPIGKRVPPSEEMKNKLYNCGINWGGA